MYPIYPEYLKGFGILSAALCSIGSANKEKSRHIVLWAPLDESGTDFKLCTFGNKHFDT